MKSIKLNKKELEDKIYACWIGKNIGGTMGGPYEGCLDMLDIQGFSTEKGEPLPNDDLDLQLVWLRAMQHVGPAGVDANVLAEYWMTVIAPHWKEYGIGKSNIRHGMLPCAVKYTIKCGSILTVRGFVPKYGLVLLRVFRILPLNMQ